MRPFDLQAFKAWRIAAIRKPFQWFARYTLFAYLFFEPEQRKIKMSDGPKRSAAGRNTVLAALAGVALLAASASPSAAASQGSAPAVSAKAAAAAQASSDVTDFSAARRHHYYRRGPNAAGLAFMGLAAGVIGGAIAESRRQEYYENRYYGPRRYYGGPGYYGGGGGLYYDPGYGYQPY